ncbi:histamine H3 receptor-like [Amphiura filiformis]|uniref:histamine H3 receptor-like n=1 Tax=Amphiura filiformis TaxID=82378 RepID=UPI003B20DD15
MSMINHTDTINAPNDFVDTEQVSSLHPVIFVLMWINVLITSGGNLLTIIIFLRDKSINHKPANLFILNLAIADLKVGLVSLPWFNLWWHYGDWIFGEKLCKFWVIVDFTACTESMIAMLLIGWDRLWMVRNIQSYVQNQTRRKTVTIIILSWMLCYTHYFVLVLLWEPVSNDWNIDYNIDCDFPPNYSLKYTIYEVVSQFSVPMLALAYFNIGVFVIISKRAKRIQPSEPMSTQDTLVGPCNENQRNQVFSIHQPNRRTTQDPSANPANIEPPSQSSGRQRKDRKAAFTLTLLVVTYAICWFPYNVVIVLETLSKDNVATWVASFTEYLLWLNSAVNPFLYVATNRQFRNHLKRTFHCETAV